MKHERALKLGLSLLVMAMGLFFVYTDWETVRTIKAAAAWPSTTGTVKGAQVFPPPDNSFRVEYDYPVNGVSYVGDEVLPRFAFTEQVVWKDNGVELIIVDSQGKSHVARYVVGEPVTVHYNPEDPGESLLVPYAPSLAPFRYGGIVLALMGLAFTGMALLQDCARRRAKTMCRSR